MGCLVHLLDQGVNVVLSVTKVTTLDEVLKLSGSETAVGVGELEGPQKVVNLLEVGANGVDLVDQVLEGQDTVLAQVGLDNGVVGESNSLLVDLAVASLVHQVSDGGDGGVTVGDVGLSQLDQLLGGLGQSDKDTGVDLGQSQQLQHLSGLRGDLHDTLDSDNEHQLVLGVNVVGAGGLGVALGLDNRALSVSVLLLVGSSSVKDNLSLVLGGLKC